MSPNNSGATPIRITSPQDLAALVPYLLGYHPHPDHDLVVLGLADNQLTTLARLDLPDPHDATALACEVLAKVARHTDSVIVIGYGPATAVTAVIDRFRRHGEHIALNVREALRISDGRAYSYLCAEPACHPADGTPVDPTGPAALAAIAAGLTAASSREDFASRLAPITGAAREGMRQATDRVIEGVARHGLPQFIAYGLTLAHAVIAAAPTGRRPTDEQVAALGLLCTVPGFAEGVLPQVEASQAQTDLWSDITRRVEPDYTAGPAALLAYAAWRRGDGPLARVAVERALAGEPAHRLAALMRDLLDAGTPPSAFDELGTAH